MKKFVVLSLVTLMALGFGSLAFAQAKKEEPKMEIRISGFIDAQFNTFRNATSGNPSAGIFDVMPTSPTNYKPTATGRAGATAIDDNVSYWMSRARLKFDAVYGTLASGTIFFEMDSDRWGESPGAQGGKLSERNTYGYWSGDRAAVEIKNVYFDFGVPGIPVPVSVRIGNHPLAIRSPLLVYTDGMGITTSIKVDPANIQLLYFKAVEGWDETADDVNIYGLHANAKVGTITVGGYGLYYNMNTYPFFVSTTTYPGATTGSIPIARLAQGTMRSDAWWLGAYADGKLGPVNLNFDFIYSKGKVESRATAVKDVKYRGWMAQGKLTYPWEKFSFGAVGMYATGADAKKTSSSGLPGSVPAWWLPATSAPANYYSHKVGSFVVPPGSESGAIYGESVVFYSYGGNRGTTGPGLSVNYNAFSRGGTGGTWLAKAFASYQVNPWYKVTFQGMYIGDTTKNGNTVGTAVKNPGLTSTVLRDDKDIGWEVDLINEIQIIKQLKLTVAGGILFAGDALDFNYRTPANIYYNYSPKNPWVITTNLTYTF